MTFEKNVEHFLVWLSSNLSKQKSPTAEIIGIYLIGTIEKVFNIFRMSKLSKPYFRKVGKQCPEKLKRHDKVKQNIFHENKKNMY